MQVIRNNVDWKKILNIFIVGVIIFLIMLTIYLNLDEFGMKKISQTTESPISEEEDDNSEILGEIPTFNYDITGYAVEKIHFIGLETTNFVVKTDQDVVDGVNLMVDRWRYTYDTIEYIFYLKDHLPLKRFECLNYLEMDESEYPAKVVVNVEYRKLNLEAIKELSLLDEIKSIYVTVPMAPLEDEESSCVVDDNENDDEYIEEVPKYNYDTIGFEVEKIHFEALDMPNFEVKTDKDVIDGINRTIRRWIGPTYDEIKFTIYTDTTISENRFANMNYEELLLLGHPFGIIVNVKAENINLEAIRELSQLDEISAIYIGIDERPEDE